MTQVGWSLPRRRVGTLDDMHRGSSIYPAVYVHAEGPSRQRSWVRTLVLVWLIDKVTHSIPTSIENCGSSEPSIK